MTLSYAQLNVLLSLTFAPAVLATSAARAQSEPSFITIDGQMVYCPSPEDLARQRAMQPPRPVTVPRIPGPKEMADVTHPQFDMSDVYHPAATARPVGAESVHSACLAGAGAADIRHGVFGMVSSPMFSDEKMRMRATAEPALSVPTRRTPTPLPRDSPPPALHLAAMTLGEAVGLAESDPGADGIYLSKREFTARLSPTSQTDPANPGPWLPSPAENRPLEIPPNPRPLVRRPTVMPQSLEERDLLAESARVVAECQRVVAESERVCRDALEAKAQEHDLSVSHMQRLLDRALTQQHSPGSPWFDPTPRDGKAQFSTSQFSSVYDSPDSHKYDDVTIFVSRPPGGTTSLQERMANAERAHSPDDPEVTDMFAKVEVPSIAKIKEDSKRARSASPIRQSLHRTPSPGTRSLTAPGMAGTNVFIKGHGGDIPLTASMTDNELKRHLADGATVEFGDSVALVRKWQDSLGDSEIFPVDWD